MGKSFVLIDVDFFNKEGLFVPQQLGFIEENSKEVSITLAQEDSLSGFDLYKCHYDKEINKRIKIGYDHFINHYYDPTDFELFYNEKLNLAVANAGNDLIRSFCEELNQTKYFKLKILPFDTNDILLRLDSINGLWISKIKEMNLESAGYFGPSVQKSERAQDILNGAGPEVSSFNAYFYSEYFGKDFSILISKKGSVVIHDYLSSTKDYILFITELYDKLLKNSLIK
ncbi:hypothetical protein [Halalkalibacter sp. APA_J-10(15)]|uniref:hypothetical protein n=1 Tax=Halalkalibacter sp. APA_J-10(15) TaxID=2933805 RepID=UPI001FF2FEC8|nr:hypothetical protein [Halalkalibacter sp. APA_J-10(15)]MCK0471434.1 hypothetical protein [Halalkalibacter sp. APA_J-10(15)]